MTPSHGVRAKATVKQKVGQAWLRRTLIVVARAGVLQGKIIREAEMTVDGKPTGQSSQVEEVWEKNEFPQQSEIYHLDAIQRGQIQAVGNFSLTSGHRTLQATLSRLDTIGLPALELSGWTNGINPATCCYDRKTPLKWYGGVRLALPFTADTLAPRALQLLLLADKALAPGEAESLGEQANSGRGSKWTTPRGVTLYPQEGKLLLELPAIGEVLTLFSDDSLQLEAGVELWTD